MCGCADVRFGAFGRAPQKVRDMDINHPPSKRVIVKTTTSSHHHRRGYPAANGIYAGIEEEYIDIKPQEGFSSHIFIITAGKPCG